LASENLHVRKEKRDRKKTGAFGIAIGLEKTHSYEGFMEEYEK